MADIAAKASPDDVPVVCLHHLGMVHASWPMPGVAEALRSVLAATLRRDAQNMRSFALKREVLRGDLVTAEESRAHDEVLRLLAGPSALARTLSSPHAGEAPS